MEELLKWSKLDFTVVLKELGSSESGLTSIQARKLLGQLGPNVLPRPAGYSTLALFLNQFRNPLIVILLIAAGITLVLGDKIDFFVIIGAVILNAGIGFFQEFKANKAFVVLQSYVESVARVLRDGAIGVLPTEAIVIGDLIELRAGDKVPADARIVSTNGFRVDESGLTGEWAPISKTHEILSGGQALGDLKNMVFMGTVATEGSARAVVVATAAATQFGTIAKEVSQRQTSLTPLQEQVSKLGKVIWRIVGGASLAIVLIGAWRAEPIGEMIAIAVAVAVAAVPEGLPAAMSVVLAMSMGRLLQKNGLVRQMVAAETLGAASVICTDKTGTLTEGRMKVAEVVTFGSNQTKGNDWMYRAMAISNDAIIDYKGKSSQRWQIKGSPTDRALLEGALESGHDLTKMRQAWPLLGRLPFSSQRKFQATFHKNDSRVALIAVGAPERILERSSRMIGQENDRPLRTTAQIEKKVKDLASHGYRVVAVGYRYINKERALRDANEETLEAEVTKLTFVGLVALRDPLRKSAIKAIDEALSAGVRVILVTGDHRLTAESVAREIGLDFKAGQVYDGQSVSAMSDPELEAAVDAAVVFSRVNPHDKLRIVEALHRRQQVVAMTGDGINDAPALRAADIGVAVGSGTDVAKEVSDLVLMDSNFSTIVAAIREGRIAFSNMRKVLVYLLSNSFAEVILVVGSLLAGVPLAILPAQILWINLLDDGFPNFALAFEPGEPNIMKNRPRLRGTPILDGTMSKLLFVISGISSLLLFGTYYFLSVFNVFELAVNRSIVFASLGIMSLALIFSVKSMNRAIWRINLFSNMYVIGAVAIGLIMVFAGLYIPLFNSILETVPLGGMAWLIVLSLTVLQMITIESAKRVFVSRNN